MLLFTVINLPCRISLHSEMLECSLFSFALINVNLYKFNSCFEYFPLLNSAQVEIIFYVKPGKTQYRSYSRYTKMADRIGKIVYYLCQTHFTK